MKSLYILSLCSLLGVSCSSRLPGIELPPATETPVHLPSQSPLAPRTETIVYENHQYTALVFTLNNKTTQWKLSYSQTPKRIETWADELDADLVVNGAFFTETFEPTGLFRADGKTITEAAYTTDTVGSIQIHKGALTLANTKRLPSTGDLFQSYPLLIRPDGAIAVKEDTEKIARRTILGQDEAGNTYVIIFGATPLSLYTASVILPRMLPELTWALNLDGGPSTGVIYEIDGERNHELPAIELPIVLSVKMVSPASPNDQ